jgi:ankyrin repeat protein
LCSFLVYGARPSAPFITTAASAAFPAFRASLAHRSPSSLPGADASEAQNPYRSALRASIAEMIPQFVYFLILVIIFIVRQHFDQGTPSRARQFEMLRGAVLDGDLQGLGLLVRKRGCSPNASSPHGETPLLLAAAFTVAALSVRDLLQLGADPDAPTVGGATVLMALAAKAATNNEWGANRAEKLRPADAEQIVELLLQAGANPSLGYQRRLSVTPITADPDEDTDTRTHTGADTTKQQQKQGAGADSADDNSLAVPASRMSLDHTLRTCRPWGALLMRQPESRSALASAAAAADASSGAGGASAAAEAAANPLKETELLPTPLHGFIQAGPGYWPVVEMLLRAGADPTVRDARGRDAAALATARGDARAARACREAAARRAGYGAGSGAGDEFEGLSLPAKRRPPPLAPPGGPVPPSPRPQTPWSSSSSSSSSSSPAVDASGEAGSAQGLVWRPQGDPELTAAETRDAARHSRAFEDNQAIPFTRPPPAPPRTRPSSSAGSLGAGAGGRPPLERQRTFDTPLMNAVRARDAAKVRALLLEGANVNERVPSTSLGLSGFGAGTGNDVSEVSALGLAMRLNGKLGGSAEQRGRDEWTEKSQGGFFSRLFGGGASLGDDGKQKRGSGDRFSSVGAHGRRRGLEAPLDEIESLLVANGASLTYDEAAEASQVKT